MKFLELKPRLAWFALMALTALSVILAESGSVGVATIPIIFAFAAVKSILVMINYMEVPLAREHWRALYLGWTAVMLVGLTVGNII